MTEPTPAELLHAAAERLTTAPDGAAAIVAPTLAAPLARLLEQTAQIASVYIRLGGDHPETAHQVGPAIDTARAILAVAARHDTPATWPLYRILAEVAVGSGDWNWDQETAYLEHDHADRLAALREDITANGITTPVLIGSDGRLWDGHHRVVAARQLGLPEVPVQFAAPPHAPQEPPTDVGADAETADGRSDAQAGAQPIRCTCCCPPSTHTGPDGHCTEPFCTDEPCTPIAAAPNPAPGDGLREQIEQAIVAGGGCVDLSAATAAVMAAVAPELTERDRLGATLRQCAGQLADAQARAEQAETLLRDVLRLTEALHDHAGRHDQLGTNLGCAGCTLADRIREHLTPTP